MPSQKIFKRTDESVASLPMKASDYIRRAVKFTPFPGEDVERKVRDGGEREGKPRHADPEDLQAACSRAHDQDR